jgi:stearoyl-CoA desaturase (Delta-9 desaturase)
MASPDPAGLKAKPEPRPKPHITDLPMTWADWHRHVNWLNVYFIAGIPLIGCIAAVWTPLRLQTAIWAVLYYFFTGMGAFSARNPFPADPR